MPVKPERTAHMRALVRAVPEAVKGACFWASPERSRELRAQGKAELLNDIPAPPPLGILARCPGWPEDRFSYVLTLWKGRRVVILGGGPSLTPEQFALVAEARAADRVRVIAVNDSYLCAPWADVLYFADSEWWRWQTEGRAKPLLGLTAEQVRERFASFAGDKCSIQNTGMNVTDPHVHLLRNMHGKPNLPGLSLDAHAVATGGHSGFQALNLGVLAGSRDFILCGFDARERALRKPGEHSHFFGDHPRIEPSAVYPLIRESFRAAQRELERAGVRVVNASLTSAIETFPKMDLRAALDSA